MIMTWEYLAGFFDGEGTLYVPSTGTAMGPRLSIAQSGAEGFTLFIEIQKFLADHGAKSTISLHRHNRATPILGKRPMWNLAMGRRADIEFVVSRLFPFLRIKRLIAQDVLRFLKIMPPLNCGVAAKVIKEETSRKRRVDPAIVIANRRARAKRFYENNKERHSAYQKAWRRKNLDRRSDNHDQTHQRPT